MLSYILIFLAYFLYFKRIKECLYNYLVVKVEISYNCDLYI
jgi:hypothetical protein